MTSLNVSCSHALFSGCVMLALLVMVAYYYSEPASIWERTIRFTQIFNNDLLVREFTQKTHDFNHFKAEQVLSDADGLGDASTESQFTNQTCQIVMFLDKMKSLEDLHHISSSCDLVLYNRVPKCGSSTVFRTLENVSRDNSFNVAKKGQFYVGTNVEQMQAASEINKQPRPSLYTRHMFFIPFHEFDIPQPFIINVVRHPINRTVSHFYYKTFGMGEKFQREMAKGTSLRGKILECAKTTADRNGCNVFLPYFCGMDASCYKRNNISLQRAMKNVEEYGMVVGITEDLRSFFWVLEALLPQFFKGSVVEYDTIKSLMINHTSTQAAKDKYPLKRKELARLPSVLGTEMELYEYLRQRFYIIKAKLERIIM